MTYQQIYKTFLAKRGFPPSPAFADSWKGEAMRIVHKNQIVDAGALHEAHIRDCNVMAACVRNSLNDFLPVVNIAID